MRVYCGHVNRRGYTDFLPNLKVFTGRAKKSKAALDLFSVGGTLINTFVFIHEISSS